MEAKEYLAVADKILEVVVSDICVECVRKGENLRPVNFSNPLSCSCRCSKVDLLLEAAQGYIRDSDSRAVIERAIQSSLASAEL